MSKHHFRFARSSGHLRPCSSGRMLQPQTFRRTPGAPVRARRSLRTSQTVACTAVMTSGVSRNGLGARGRGLSPLAGYGRELRARRLTRPYPSRLSYQRSCKPACSVGYRAHQSMACEKVQRRWPTHTRSIQNPEQAFGRRSEVADDVQSTPRGSSKQRIKLPKTCVQTVFQLHPRTSKGDSVSCIGERNVSRFTIPAAYCCFEVRDATSGLPASKPQIVAVEAFVGAPARKSNSNRIFRKLFSDTVRGPPPRRCKKSSTQEQPTSANWKANSFSELHIFSTATWSTSRYPRTRRCTKVIGRLRRPPDRISKTD